MHVREFSFRVPWGLGAFILVTAAVLIVWYIYEPNHRSVLVYIAAVGTAVGALFSVLIAMAVRSEQTVALRELRGTIESQVQAQQGQVTALTGLKEALVAQGNAQEKRAAERGELICLNEAFRLIRAWNDPAFFPMQTTFWTCLKELDGKLPHQQVPIIVDNDDYRRAVNQTLNFFEMMALAINRKVVDEETLKLFFRGVVTRCWAKLEAYARSRRTDTGTPGLFVQIEHICHNWR